MAKKKNAKAAATPAGPQPRDPRALLTVAFAIAVLAGWYLLASGPGSWLSKTTNDALVNKLALALSVAALGLLAWGYSLAQNGAPLRWLKFRDQALLALGLLGALSYSNFGYLHWQNFIHAWDTYHYYMGAKYFPELGYDLLYDCAVVADSEVGLKGTADRVVTDLRTNVMVKVTDLLAHPERCKDRFSASRWADYKADLAWFRTRFDTKRWSDMHHDHGYNATPVWTLLGFALANTGTAGLTQVTLIDLLDPLYLLLTALALGWAFGFRVFAIGLLALGAHFPNRYYWTGGAMLRYDWLFFTVLTVCLLKKNRPTLAGASIAYATLLRLFPGLLLLGPALWAVNAWTKRRTDEESARAVKFTIPRFALGGIAATFLLVGTSLLAFGGTEPWKTFAHNTQKHANTPLTNHMGLRTVLSYRPWTIGARLRDGNAIDPWAKWKETRLENFAKAKPVFVALLLGMAALFFLAIRDSNLPLWAAAALGSGTIVFGAELTCYYYCFLMAFAPLYEKKREAGLLLLALCAVSQFIGLAPIPSMSKWEDEQYTAMSLAALFAVAGTAWVFTRWSRHDNVEPDPAVERFVP